MRQPLRSQLERLASDRWARQGVRTLLRATWAGLSLWCIGLGLSLLLDRPVSFELLGALALSCIAIGAVLLLRRPLRPHEVARRLDRRFNLKEQLGTALEVSAAGPAEGVAERLLEHSSRTIIRVRRHISHHQQLPWGEFAAVLALVLISLGLLMLTGIGSLDLRPAALPLPPLVRAPDPTERFPPEPPGNQPGMGNQPGSGNQPGQVALAPVDQQAIAALADALRDQSVTRPAADALDRGDTAGAAQSLRELADQAGRLSETARRDLAQALDDAARRLQGSNPDLAQQLRENANDLRQGGQQAAAGLSELAETIERLGQGQGPGQMQGQADQGQTSQGQADQGQGSQGQGDQGQGQNPGSGAGSGPPGDQRAQAQPSERLGVDGVPLELESEGEGNRPTGNEPQGDPRAGNAPGRFERGSNPSGNRVQTGDDPLRIPADLRDVVQEYFSP